MTHRYRPGLLAVLKSVNIVAQELWLTAHGVLEQPSVTALRTLPQMRTLDPATQAYSFWEGVPVDARAAFGRLFAASATLRGLAVVQRALRGAPPAAAMAELGFGRLRLVDSFPVSMSGARSMSL